MLGRLEPPIGPEVQDVAHIDDQRAGVPPDVHPLPTRTSAVVEHLQPARVATLMVENGQRRGVRMRVHALLRVIEGRSRCDPNGYVRGCCARRIVQRAKIRHVFAQRRRKEVGGKAESDGDRAVQFVAQALECAIRRFVRHTKFRRVCLTRPVIRITKVQRRLVARAGVVRVALNERVGEAPARELFVEMWWPDGIHTAVDGNVALARMRRDRLGLVGKCEESTRSRERCQDLAGDAVIADVHEADGAQGAAEACKCCVVTSTQSLYGDRGQRHGLRNAAAAS